MRSSLCVHIPDSVSSLVFQEGFSYRRTSQNSQSCNRAPRPRVMDKLQEHRLEIVTGSVPLWLCINQDFEVYLHTQQCMYVCVCVCVWGQQDQGLVTDVQVSGVWEVTPATGVSTTTHQLHNTVLATTSNSWDMRFKGENRKTCDGLDSGAGLGENRMGTCTDTLSPPGIMLHPQYHSFLPEWKSQISMKSQFPAATVS